MRTLARHLHPYPHKSTLHIFWLILITFALAPAPARAQSFFTQTDPSGNAAAAADCERAFVRTLTGQGMVERPSAEVERMVRECVSDLSNPSFVQECDLNAARGQVDYVLFVGARQDSGVWLFYVEALSPLQSGTVWQNDEVSSESSSMLASRDVCAALASDFLRHQEIIDPGPSSPALDVLPGVVHIVHVNPSPASLWINGVEAGTVPGQYAVPTDAPVILEIRSPGHAAWSSEVRVAEGELLSLRDIVLEVLPTQIQVVANVQGATILLNGRPVGTTLMQRPVAVSAPAGRHQVELTLDGYEAAAQSMEGVAGASTTLQFQLTPVAPPPAPVAVVTPPAPQPDPEPEPEPEPEQAPEPEPVAQTPSSRTTSSASTVPTTVTRPAPVDDGRSPLGPILITTGGALLAAGLGTDLAMQMGPIQEYDSLASTEAERAAEIEQQIQSIRPVVGTLYGLGAVSLIAGIITQVASGNDDRSARTLIEPTWSPGRAGVNLTFRPAAR